MMTVKCFHINFRIPIVFGNFLVVRNENMFQARLVPFLPQTWNHPFLLEACFLVFFFFLVENSILITIWYEEYASLLSLDRIYASIPNPTLDPHIFT